MREHDLVRAIKLASNENPFAPLPSVVDAIGRAATGINRYADHRATAVRERIAAKFGVDPAMVGVGCGSVGLLQQIALAYAGTGSSVAFGWLSFEAYPIFAQIAGASSITVPNCDHVIDLDALSLAITPTTRIVFLANPNNPTGTAFDQATLERFLGAVRSDVLVVLDEAYHEFVTDPAVPNGISMLADHPNLAVLRTFSKAYGLAGLRIGYLVAHPEIVAHVDKTLIPFAVNHLAQVAAIASLDAEAELLERCTVITSERSRVLAAVRSRGLAAPDAQANFVWLQVGDNAAGLTLALERLGVVTRPFAGAGVRVTIGSAAENDQFLDALRSCWSYR